MKISHFTLFTYYFILLALGCTLSSCGSAPEPAPRGKLPDIKTDSPRYTTDQEIYTQITAVKSQLLENPKNPALLLKLASLQVEIDQDTEAIENLEQLKALNYNEEPKIYATLGSLYSKQENFNSARDNYIIFKKMIAGNVKLEEKTDKIITDLEFKIQVMSSPYNINLRPLHDDINTNASEYLSKFTIDGEELIFIRRTGAQEDLYYAVKNGEGFDVSPIDELNTLESEGAHTISADGSLLIFTHCSEKFGYGSCDLYAATKSADSTWSKPANLGRTINTRYWESQPSLSPDGNLLFYVSTKPEGSNGGSDIWVSRRTSSGTWSNPQNAGKTINTSARDETPFFHPDGQTLYFRSTGHPNIGDFDIFMSKREVGGWGEVVNVGSPINTPGNDGALSVSLDGLTGYYATDNYGGVQKSNLDIYALDLPSDFRPISMTYVKGRIVNTKGLPLEASIQIEYLDGLPVKSNYKTNFNGEFLAAVPVGIPTLLNVNSEGYIFYSDHIDYDQTKDGRAPHELDVVLSPIVIKTTTEDKPVVLTNVFFESASATLKDISLSEITQLKDLLLKNADLSIRIIGHTDDVGDDADNLELSQSRADAVKAALVEMDIASSRIETEGVGESQPIADNKTAEGRATNRRTEFVIIR